MIVGNQVFGKKPVML